MTRTDKCLAYAVVLLSAWAIAFIYTDHWNNVAAMNNAIPGCRSGKYACDMHFTHGQPVVEMWHREAGR